VKLYYSNIIHCSRVTDCAPMYRSSLKQKTYHRVVRTSIPKC